MSAKTELDDLAKKLAARVTKLDKTIAAMEEIVLLEPSPGDYSDRNSVAFLNLRAEYESLMKLYTQSIETLRKAVTAADKEDPSRSFEVDELYQLLKSKNVAEIRVLKQALENGFYGQVT